MLIIDTDLRPFMVASVRVVENDRRRLTPVPVSPDGKPPAHLTDNAAHRGGPGEAHLVHAWVRDQMRAGIGSALGRCSTPRRNTGLGRRLRETKASSAVSGDAFEDDSATGGQGRGELKAARACG